MPTSGGRSRLVQGIPPSYWHGWSPDGSTLAYVAKRSETFQVFTCPVGGGEEYQVTHDFDHCDGPDYTSDGQWIWFNGQIGGSTQLWRIQPDGTGQQQMTSSEQANWFPHPSPDGKHILFLAFPSGTAGHPRDRDVGLRLLPADGGHDRLLLALFGGQATINVPCWGPDSASFAFVRYRKG